MFEIGLVFIVAGMLFIATLHAKGELGGIVMLMGIILGSILAISSKYLPHAAAAGLGGFILARLWLARQYFTKEEG